MCEEHWKAIPGYEGLYEASDLGRIRSLDRLTCVKKKSGNYFRKTAGRVLQQTIDSRGLYKLVMLCKEGTNVRHIVHRLIAKTFISNPLNLPEVNHKDEDKTNNAVSNLEWCDRAYNNNYGSKYNSSRGERNQMAKLTVEKVKQIRDEVIPGDPEHSMTKVAEKYGVSVTHVCGIVHRRYWGWVK